MYAKRCNWALLMKEYRNLKVKVVNSSEGIGLLELMATGYVNN